MVISPGAALDKVRAALPAVFWSWKRTRARSAVNSVTSGSTAVIAQVRPPQVSPWKVAGSVMLRGLVHMV